MEKWNDIYEISPCTYAKQGIVFHKKINFFGLPEFKEGLFEVQDEGSQLVADMVQVKPGQWVMDYCAGSGGKTLAFAPRMEKTGQIFLHDSRPYALEEARKRLRRAGVQNSQVVLPDDPKLKKLKKKMHWVLVDAPCTGTGTMRRNPDMKWNFDEQTLTRLLGLQRSIFEKALSFLRPDGYIVYATCSLLREENQNQMEHFIKTYDLEAEGPVFQSLPSRHGMDAFFSICLKFKK
jgi:16S rRNA C967 or C1407 C5-methylase (RsmB/RsmF family)